MTGSNRREFLKKAGLGLILVDKVGQGLLYDPFDNNGFTNKEDWSENIKTILENTKLLTYPRMGRLPLYVWPAVDPGEMSEETAGRLVELLDKRGVGVICSWRWREDRRLKSLEVGLSIAKAQKRLGQPVNIDASSLLYSFYDGSEETAHIDDNNNPFFDNSFGIDHKIGCPFTLNEQKDRIRERVTFFSKKYKEEGLEIDFIFTDWEIDGPIAVNGAFKASQKCKRCKKHLGEDFSYTKFQKQMMDMRAYLQYYTYVDPILSRFPSALVGNYGDYPNDGYRYWYDYFESHQPWEPYKQDQKAKYRQWYESFSKTGFTMAMPVVYTWKNIYKWYEFEDTDYRWFYNMLLVASNGVKNTDKNIPIVSFVHWNTIFIGRDESDAEIKQMSENGYRELLWHMLLRGTDSFFMWSERKNFPKEVRLVHEVYASALQFRDFLEHGWAITYDVPEEEGTVISGLAYKDKVLVRRTDFGSDKRPVLILAGSKLITVDYKPGICQIISLR